MRVRFAIEGGLAHFPGLAEPVEIELSSLPEAEAGALRALLERSSAPPAETAGQAGGLGRGADRRCYRIEVDRAAGPPLELRLEEPIPDPELGRLVRTLEALARRLRRTRAGGG
ncbi:MAG: hypothetical protein NZ555_06625 [Geminicoccaceae bacterium]|nr:hypothetical protein [Geminicoccaceae bacterium]MDW8369494.1 hypothetical protein [Geminicoccaceae bacterium]